MKEFILEQEEDFRLVSANEDLEKALRYSRGVYNLEDVAAYDNPVEEDEEDDENSEDMLQNNQGEYDTYNLSSEERNLISLWKVKNLPEGTTTLQVGRNVLKFLRGDVQDPQRKLFRDVTDTQIKAFEIMLENIQRSKKELFKKNGLTPTNFPPEQKKEHSAEYLELSWENICAARTFQLLCRSLMSADGLNVSIYLIENPN